MKFQIEEMKIVDYEAALDLWNRCEGIGLSDADEPQAIARFLEKNRGLCFVARAEGRLVGTCLCGSDGRRGYLYHLAVDPLLRGMGIGKSLAARALDELRKQDIHKCHIMVYGKNESGLAFWKRCGWVTRPEIELMSFDVMVTGEGPLPGC